MMKPGARVYEKITTTSSPNWAAVLAVSGPKFMVKGSTGAYLAVVTQPGDLYLAGQVKPGQEGPLQPDVTGPAFEITRPGAQNARVVVSLIDSGGNLKLLKDDHGGHDRPENGYVLYNGIRRELVENYSNDAYFWY